ncbi:GntR family transcriptional regulator [Hufsiella ginkgonis]|uniref:GntR family transcriptional regulator n=1 Tax=Hufsiella ginkgonis TaxID=2695274 RepID=A0A7K1Y4E0_9SPHI|nr:GntR family transcriptional regulator [Hufsiella ginkgonis]MXV17929.1 GntR family transcriptional regulator [Hufsiella ginkgonis]
MDFNQSQAIYRQIAEYVSDNIQLGKWLPDEKIPSVRELAVTLEVNPNTVMRSYDHLQQQDVIYIKRGLGYYVGSAAREKITDARKKIFLEEELPAVFAKMRLYEVSVGEVQQRFELFTREV